MAQLWTVIFIAVLAVGFGLAHSHDCEDAKARERRGDPRDRGGGAA